jgi:hypothetical protein
MIFPTSGLSSILSLSAGPCRTAQEGGRTHVCGDQSMKPFLLAIYALLLFEPLGCEKAADISSPIKYEKENVSFSYPQNWKVTEDVRQQDLHYIFVESPGDAIFIIQIYSKNGAVSFNEFVEWFSSQSKAEIPVGKMEESIFSTVEKGNIATGMKGIKENFSITLVGEKVPHTREYYTVDSDNEIAFLVTQTATEDMRKTESGFDLILSSFVIE